MDFFTATEPAIRQEIIACWKRCDGDQTSALWFNVRNGYRELLKRKLPINPEMFEQSEKYCAFMENAKPVKLPLTISIKNPDIKKFLEKPRTAPVSLESQADINRRKLRDQQDQIRQEKEARTLPEGDRDIVTRERYCFVDPQTRRLLQKYEEDSNVLPQFYTGKGYEAHQRKKVKVTIEVIED